jgi:ATP-dependent DNA ligase
MLAKAVDAFPEGPDLVWEPKWDGFRCLAHRDGRTALTSKSGSRMDARWPELHDAVRDTIPEGTILDGEIVRWADGRLDFDALLRRNGASGRTARRLAAEEPCHLIVFDLLRLDGRDLTRHPLASRRAQLEELWLTVSNPHLMLGWQTASRDVALTWWEEMTSVGVEGLVAKDSRRSYRPGKRDWLKYKHRVTTEAIIGGTIGPPERPRALILGRRDPDTGELRVAGRTTDLSPRLQHELEDLLHASGADHPWGPTLAPRWGETQRIHYTRVRPEVVVEIQPDTATVAGRWRHPVRAIRPRTDLRPQDVPLGLDLEA